MALTTVRPSTTLGLTGATLSSPSPPVGDEWTFFADDDDLTYAQSDGFSLHRAGLSFAFDSPTIPGADQIKEFRLRARFGTTGVGTFVFDQIGCCQQSLPTLDFYSLFGPITIELGRAKLLSLADIPGTVAAQFDWYMTTDGPVVRIYELYIDFVHVEQPVVNVDGPTGTLTDSNLPTVAWTNTLDTDGGAQTHFEVKIFDSATYGGGGFDPDTSEPVVASGERPTRASVTTWRDPDTPLLNASYRAYVRIAQTVNETVFWSDWDYSAFTVNVPTPAEPKFVLVPDGKGGRMVMVIGEGTGGAVSTDQFEIEHSLDGGETWEPVRTRKGDGLVDAD